MMTTTARENSEAVTPAMIIRDIVHSTGRTACFTYCLYRGIQLPAKSSRQLLSTFLLAPGNIILFV